MAIKKRAKSISSILGDVSPIRDILLQFVGSFFGHFIDQLQEDIAERVEEIQADLKVKTVIAVKIALQAFVVFFLMSIGGFFMFLGLANVLDFIFKIDGAGFLLVGVVMTFLGFIFALLTIKKTGKQNK